MYNLRVTKKYKKVDMFNVHFFVEYQRNFRYY